MAIEFTCRYCGQSFLTHDQDAAAADREARDRFGIDPAQYPERFAIICEDCVRKLEEPVEPVELRITPRHAHTRCPGCGIETEELAELTASLNGPRPGGFIVCPRCASISVYNARMELRPVERSDLNMLMEINPEGFMLLLAAVMAARESIREHARNN